MTDATARASGAVRIVVLAAVVVALVAAGVAVAVIAGRDDGPSLAAATTTVAPTAPVSTDSATTTLPTTTTAPASTAPVSTVPPSPGGDYVAVPPARLVDTRTGVGTSTGRPAKSALVTASIAGKTGSSAVGQVKAVALNVTIAEPSAPGYLTVAAAGTHPFDVSQIAFVSATASSLIVTGISPEGLIELRLSDGASSHIIVDLLGYFVSDRSPDRLSIVPEPQPVPLIDTRPSVPVDPGKTVDITLPDPQAGAILGITATGARGPGYLTVYGGSTRPDTSAVNFAAGHDATALSIVATGSDRVVHIFNGSTSTVHIVAFQLARLVPGTPAGGLALNIEGTIAQDGRSAPFPFRTVDTRGTATCQASPGGGVSSISTIFPKAKALLVSITVVNSSIASYLTAYSGTGPAPSVATLNYDAREVRSNLAFVPVSGDRVNLVCGGGNPEYILDVLATLE